jgi:outer membrane protein W
MFLEESSWIAKDFEFILESHEWIPEREMRMKKILFRKEICVFIALVLFLSAVGFSQTEDLEVRVRVRRANVREQPNLKGEIIAVVKRGQILQVDRKEGEWYFVRLPLSLEGYALPGYIHESVVQVVGKEKEQAEIKKPKKRVEDRPVRFGIGLLAGLPFISDENYNSKANINGYFSYRVTEAFSLELSVHYIITDVEGRPSGLSAGDLSSIPVQMSIQRHFFLREKTFLYVSGGINYYFTNFSVEDSSMSREETVEGTLGFHIGAGVEYFVKENLILKLDMKYCFASTSGSWSYIDPVLGPQSGQIDDIQLDTLLFGIGIKFFF